MQFIIHSPDGKESVTGDAATLDSLCRAMADKHGSVGKIETVEQTAQERVQAQHAALKEAGIITAPVRTIDHGSTVSSAHVAREQKHEAKLPAAEAVLRLSSVVRAEGRRDVETTAAALARQIETNGKLRAAGWALNEQAIRGLLGRCESPALGYVLGIRDRIRENVTARISNPAVQPAIDADKAKLAEVLRHELAMAGDVSLKLRVRESRQDCYAVVSPSYEAADAPEVLASVVDGLPRDAKATWAYDPASTSWELRASVWTPTPAAEHAIGEAFEGYVSLRSKDNGTGSFRAGGGTTFLICLNSATFEAEGSITRRKHTRNIMVDVAAVLKHGTAAIDALCAAWGVARSEVVEVPTGIRIEDAIPDFWSSMLTQRQYAFAGLLPGRTKEHAAKLTEAYFDQRRDRNRVVRGDFAQAWTRYIQEQPADVRREAEAAAGAWLVGGRMPRLSDSVSSVTQA